MATITIYLIAVMSIILFLKETNNSCKQGYIIPDRIDIHCEIQAVPFAQLSQMQPGEPSAAIRERVIKARTIADLAGSEKVKSISRHARHGTHTLFLLYDHLVLGCTIAEPAAKGTGHVAVQILFHGKEGIARQG